MKFVQVTGQPCNNAGSHHSSMARTTFFVNVNEIKAFVGRDIYFSSLLLEIGGKYFKDVRLVSDNDIVKLQNS
ncbi:MAG: hypothetical protein KDC90_13325 [Ignavibacteriae bacterium]|nr:hypothetical protein [Ignavibacteriota bacterium]